MILYTVENGKYFDLKNYENIEGMKCYVNSTNRCSCACTFCLRQTKEMMKGNSLWLEKEPTVEDITREFDQYDISLLQEVIFCGFGEPLIRHDDLMKVAAYLKQRDEKIKIRINTNGLSSFSNHRDITPDFKGLIDTVSISLNAPTKEEYFTLTRSQFGKDSFDEMLDFTKKCKEYVPHVVLTVVDIIGEEKIKQSQAIAQRMGVTLRVRPFE